MLYKFVIVIDNSIVTHAKLPKRFEFIPFMYKKVDIKPVGGIKLAHI